jgi:hypothetical protein
VDKHTPGPWEAEQAHERQDLWWDIEGAMPKGLTPGRYNIADTMNRHHCVSPDEDRANARLIAAAPELLAACRRLLHFGDDCGDHCSNSCQWCQLRAAISKAEGESHA